MSNVCWTEYSHRGRQSLLLGKSSPWEEDTQHTKTCMAEHPSQLRCVLQKEVRWIEAKR